MRQKKVRIDFQGLAGLRFRFVVAPAAEIKPVSNWH